MRIKYGDLALSLAVVADEVEEDSICVLVDYLSENENKAVVIGEQAQKCGWIKEGERRYETDCGNGFVFTVDGPIENEMTYCPFCGKQIEEQQYTDDEEE